MFYQKRYKIFNKCNFNISDTFNKSAFADRKLIVII